MRCGCGRWYTARTGTPVQGMTADWRQLTTLVILTFRKQPIDQISAACELTEDTIRRYLKRLQ